MGRLIGAAPGISLRCGDLADKLEALSSHDWQTLARSLFEQHPASPPSEKIEAAMHHAGRFPVDHSVWNLWTMFASRHLILRPLVQLLARVDPSFSVPASP